jgi:hypothetical protein
MTVRLEFGPITVVVMQTPSQGGGDYFIVDIYQGPKLIEEIHIDDSTQLLLLLNRIALEASIQPGLGF